MGPSTPYSNLLTPRSRRLRTLGALFLVVTIVLACVGLFVLMPHLNSNIQRHRNDRAFRMRDAGGRLLSLKELTPAERRIRKALSVQIAFAYAYWGVVGLSTLSAVFMAWLDFREVSRSFSLQRRALVSDTILRKQIKVDTADSDRSDEV